MKTLLGLLLAVALLVVLIGYGCSRTADKYKVCRSIGHGPVYCALAMEE